MGKISWLKLVSEIRSNDHQIFKYASKFSICEVDSKMR